MRSLILISYMLTDEESSRIDGQPEVIFGALPHLLFVAIAFTVTLFQVHTFTILLYAIRICRL